METPGYLKCTEDGFIPTCQGIDSFSTVLLLPCEITSHRLNAKQTKYQFQVMELRLLQDKIALYITQTSYMSLAASCLAIGKTSCHTAFKYGLHQRFGCEAGRRKRIFKTNKEKTIVARIKYNNTPKHKTAYMTVNPAQKTCKIKTNENRTCRPGCWWRSHQRSSQSGRFGCPSTW